MVSIYLSYLFFLSLHADPITRLPTHPPSSPATPLLVVLVL